ncbi:Alcohol dehydrogenase 2 [Cryomyces minteri]|uniref:Alcohol dehydrogenase 2 n=1 Tax=Cryomyces minteri TaxID=331657 RepID=A0A4U0Y0S2_9PEZI|nr:Alcohol dehydrogenase 2 [Cryomyces minteri]
MGDVSLPKKYKAAVYDKPGSISTKIEELDMPEPGPGEVLINLTHSGVCHSDMGVMMNSWFALPAPTQAGQVGGHEGVGKIVKMGPGTESAAVKVGDRVGVKWKVSGYYTPGTFQQYVIGPANYVTPIPDNLDSAAAAPLLCAGVTVYSALRKSGAKSGQFVVILGAGGGLGHLAVQIASRGIGLRVIGIDHGSKEKLVTDSGAEAFIDHTKGDAEEEVKKLTGGMGAHAVIVLTAANGAYASAMDLLRFGGTLVCVGIPEGDPLPVAKAYPQILIAKAQRIVGVAVGDRQEAIETLDLAARGVVKSHFRTAKMDELTAIFEDMFEGKLQGRVVLDLQ